MHGDKPLSPYTTFSITPKSPQSCETIHTGRRERDGAKCSGRFPAPSLLDPKRSLFRPENSRRGAAKFAAPLDKTERFRRRGGQSTKNSLPAGNSSLLRRGLVRLDPLRQRGGQETI